jgi:hypothetical protein
MILGYFTCLVFIEFDGRDYAGIVEHVGRVAERCQRPQVAVAGELCQAIGKLVQTGEGRIFFIFRIRVCKKSLLPLLTGPLERLERIS